jgi:hypothetical protein
MDPGKSFCGECGSSVTGEARVIPSATPHTQGVLADSAGVPKATSRFKWPALLTLSGLVLAVAAAYLPWHWVGLGRDPLVARLIGTPLPASSYQGWKLEKPGPEISEDKDPEEGQVGVVRATITRSGGQDLGGFFFTVFKNPGQARNSYQETIKSDTAPGIGKVITPSGITGSCLGTGPKVLVCRSLVGRTVVSVLFTSGESEQMAVASTRALVEHVSALEN